MKWGMVAGFLLLLAWAAFQQYWFLCAIFVLLTWGASLMGD